MSENLIITRQRETSLLEIRNLKAYYMLSKGFVKAVDGVDLSVRKSEIVGLAGESGCGKSTIAFSILRILPQNGKIVDGSILFEDKNIVAMSEDEIGKVRWKEISIIFQGAMNALNPVRTIEDQIAEAILEHEEITEEKALDRSRELLRLVGIDPSRGRDYPHEFSGGMKQRAVIAMALACNPKLVIADEPTMALDVMVQAQILDLIKKLKEKLKLSVLLISHDLSMIAENCDKVSIMYAGKIVESAEVEKLFTSPFHPYTKALMRAIPKIDEKNRELLYISGAPPNLVNPPPGCRFHPRCKYAKEICRKKEPKLFQVEKEHYVACHLIN